MVAEYLEYGETHRVDAGTVLGICPACGHHQPLMRMEQDMVAVIECPACGHRYAVPVPHAPIQD